jgi:hypothetical protein
VTQVGIAKKFKADLGNLPAPIARKAAVWLAEFLVDPEDARFEAHRIARSLMPNLWTAKLDDSYRVIYRLDQDGVRHLLLCDAHDRAYRRAEKLRAVNLDGVVEVVEGAGGEAPPHPRTICKSCQLISTGSLSSSMLDVNGSRRDFGRRSTCN